MISGDLRNFLGKTDIETYIIHPNQSKSREFIVENVSWRILFQEQVKFLKSGIWFQFYNASNKDTFFRLTRYYNKLFGIPAR